MKDFIAHAESGDLKKLSGAKSADELVKLASDGGFNADRATISHTMRNIAGTELQKRGFPGWAVESVLNGDAVCW